MLDTSSSTGDFPLFGTMSGSSSCGMEAIVIQRPLPTESYSWTDIAFVVQDDSQTKVNIPQARTTTTTTTNKSYMSNHNHNPTEYDESSLVSFSHSSSSSTLSTSASGISIASGNSCINDSENISSKENELPASGKKNVRFASSPHVRTYSLVLGNHPLCDDGLAIELGWDYSEEEHNINMNNNYINYVGGHPLTSQQSQQQQQQQQLQQSRCQRRSYLSRKQLLLNVAGCTKEELDQRTRDLDAEKSLLEQAISHREDYYYCLAFAKR